MATLVPKAYNTNEGGTQVMHALHTLLLLTAFFGGQPQAAPAPSAPEIRELVMQLEAPRLAEREAAEAELLRRGPDILKLLPAPNDQASPELQHRLARVRNALQREFAQSAAKASTVTLQAEAMPLDDVLAALQRQSGNAILDQRRALGQPADNPLLHVNFVQTPFWPALDQVLNQAGLMLCPVPGRSAIGTAAKPNDGTLAGKSEPGYSGPFRFQAVHATLRSADALTVGLQVAWEPRLTVINLVQRMRDLKAFDREGRALPLGTSDAQFEMLGSAAAFFTRFDLPLTMPRNETAKVSRLEGALLATMAGESHTFQFRQLAHARQIRQRFAAVVVTLEQVRRNRATWEIRMRVRFDEAGDALASHRTWIFSNPAYLETDDGRRVDYKTFDTTSQSDREVGIAFSFDTDQPLENPTFCYRTPTTILQREIGYVLKGIEIGRPEQPPERPRR